MNFRPLHDCLLVKPLTTLHSESFLVIPQTAKSLHSYEPGRPDDLFLGEVVATGPGDQLLHRACSQCGLPKSILKHKALMRGRRHSCPNCGGKDWDLVGSERIPVQVKVGDRIVFPRRPNTPAGEWDGVWIDGERYLLFNEEQSCLAVLEPEEQVEPEEMEIPEEVAA